jgi:hypothetical protein
MDQELHRCCQNSKLIMIKQKQLTIKYIQVRNFNFRRSGSTEPARLKLHSTAYLCGTR